MSSSGFPDQPPNPYQTPASGDESLREQLDLPSTSQIVMILGQTRPWVRFLSVLGFLASALMLGGGCIMFVVMLASRKPMESLLGLVYAGFAVLYIIPSLHLYRYADRIRTLETTGSSQSLASALEAQKSFWRFVGILMAVILVGYAAILVMALLAAFVVGFVR